MNRHGEAISQAIWFEVKLCEKVSWFGISGHRPECWGGGNGIPVFFKLPPEYRDGGRFHGGPWIWTGWLYVRKIQVLRTAGRKGRCGELEASVDTWKFVSASACRSQNFNGAWSSCTVESNNNNNNYLLIGELVIVSRGFSLQFSFLRYGEIHWVSVLQWQYSLSILQDAHRSNISV